MTPEEQIKQLEQEVRELKTIVNSLVFSSNLFTSRNLNFQDGINIIFDTRTGTRIGTATTQKLAFWNATPVAQQASIADADGTLADATTKINSILDVLDALGFTA